MKIWDEVKLRSSLKGLTSDKYNHTWKWVIVEDDWTSNPFKVKWADNGRIDWWYDKIWELIPYVEKMDRIKIGELNCKYRVSNNAIEITHRQYIYITNFYWEPEIFMRENQGLILKYFISAMEKDVGDVLNNFSLEFDKLVKKLWEFYFPYTKDMIIAHTMEALRKNVTKVAELFSEPQIKNTILSFFK